MLTIYTLYLLNFIFVQFALTKLKVIYGHENGSLILVFITFFNDIIFLLLSYKVLVVI